jgi:mono/diheme cytochrome c family protein
MMPYRGYSHLSDEDARSIVAYFRTLPPVHRSVPAKRIRFPLNLLLKSVPRPLDGPVPPVAASDSVAYGKYLTTIGGCVGCHTTEDARHRPIPGMEFAGGNEYRGPWGKNRSANLTRKSTPGWAATKGVHRPFQGIRAARGELPGRTERSEYRDGWLAYSA